MLLPYNQDEHVCCHYSGFCRQCKGGPVFPIQEGFVDGLDALARGLADALPDFLQRLGRQRRPAAVLPYDAQRLARPVRAGRVARELPVGHVGIVLDGTQRLDHIHPRGPFPRRQLRSQRRALPAGRQIDIFRRLPAAIVGGAPRREQIAGPEGRARAMVKRPFLLHILAQTHGRKGPERFPAHLPAGGQAVPGLIELPILVFHQKKRLLYKPAG